GKYVTSKADAQLTATKSSIGLWEQVNVWTPPRNTWSYLLPRNPGNRWIGVHRSAAGKPVKTRGTAEGEWEAMRLDPVPGQPGVYRIFDKGGYYWRVDATGAVWADSRTPTGNAYLFR